MAYPSAAPRPYGGYPVNTSAASPRLIHTGGKMADATANFDNTTVGATTELRLGEIFLPLPVWSTGAANFNGGNVTDDCRIILYNANGTIIASTAGAQQVTVDIYQRHAWAWEFVSVPGTATAVVNRVLLSPGTYYLGIIHDGTTSTVQTFVVGSFGASMVAAVYATAGLTTSLTVVPPTTFTTLQGPVIGLY